MEDLIRKIENELSSLSVEERQQMLEKLRLNVNDIDKSIVKLISRRTLHSVLIGRIKRSLGLPTYSPEREKDISKRIVSFAESPLTPEALRRIYERILDESRAIQKIESSKGNIFKLSEMDAKTNLKNFFSLKQLLIIASFFLAVLALLYYTFFTGNYYTMDSPVDFDINRGESMTQVIERLYERGIIPGKTNMRIASFIYGADKRIRAARYKIPNGLSYLDLLDLFTKGDADFIRKVKIREGVSVKWLASKLKREALIDSASFVNLAYDKSFISSLGISAPSLEGYLFPDEYYFFQRSPADEVIGIMFDGFNNFMNDTLKQRASELGLTVHEVVTLASIVKGETNRVSEMPVIAGVYLNRLRIGMPLQADPTLQYIQPGGWKRLLYEDLKVDSPYNTYKYKGLPPGAINNPGRNSILSVLFPENHNYLFFVADGKGGHNFSENYSQHLKYVQEYRRWIKSQK